MRNSEFSIRRIIKGASIYSSGEALVKVSGFFLIPVYTRVLMPTEYGIVAYLQAVLSVVTVVFGLGFSSAQTRQYYDNSLSEKEFGKFAFTINIPPLLLATFILPVVSFIGYKSGWSLNNGAIPFYPFLVLTLYAGVFSVFSNNAVSLYRAKQKFLLAASLRVGNFALLTAFSLLFILKFDMGALGQVAGITSGFGLFSLLCIVLYGRIFVFRFSWESFLFALTFGAPIVVHLLSASIHNVVDRIILERYVDISVVGFYSVALAVGQAFNILIISFNQAFQPSYYQLMASADDSKAEKVLKVFKLWLLAVTIISIGLITLGGPFLKVFAGERFSSATEVLPLVIYAIYTGGFYFFFAAPIFYFKRTKFLPLITVSSAVLNIILNLLWIPKYGIMGAAASTVISHVLQSIIAYIIGNKLYSIKWPAWWMVLSFVIVTSGLILYYS